MASARRQNLSEQVAARIKQLIIDEGLKPGDRLPTEQEMATRFGVSRVSVREATKALSFLGIIRAAPRRGLTIGEVDMRRVTEYLSFHFALGDYSKRELLQTRLVIEGGVLPYVAEAMVQDPAIGQGLTGLIEEGQSAETFADQMQNDIAFHRALLEASGVGPLLVIDNLLQIFFVKFTNATNGRPWQTTLEQHQTLVDLLHRNQIEPARKLLEEHIGQYFSRLTS